MLVYFSIKAPKVLVTLSLNCKKNLQLCYSIIINLWWYCSIIVNDYILFFSQNISFLFLSLHGLSPSLSLSLSLSSELINDEPLSFSPMPLLITPFLTSLSLNQNLPPELEINMVEVDISMAVINELLWVTRFLDWRVVVGF